MIWRLVVLMCFLCVGGCDTFNGPRVRNELGSEVSYKAGYSDGKRISGVFNYCVGTFLGRPEARIVSLEVYKNNEFLFEVDKEELAIMLRQEGAEKEYSAWALREEGFVLAVGKPLSCDGHSGTN